MAPEDARTLRSLLAAVMSMQLITPFLQTGVAVLLPALGEAYHCSATELGLVSTVYCMALAVFNLAMGRAGDKWGRRRTALFSMVVLVPTSALTGLCPNIESVLALRVLQGVGTAAFSTSALAMLVACSPPESRGRMLGLSSTSTFIGIAAGPVVGGYVNLFLGWEWYFYGISAWAAACFAVMALLVKREWTERPEAPYDWKGLALLSLGMCLLVQGCVGPMPDGQRPWCAGAGLLVNLLFLIHEYRERRTVPLLDVRVLLHNRTFVLANLANFALYASLFSLAFFFSLYLQYAKGMDSSRAGAVIFLQAAVQAVCTWPGGWLADRVGAFPVSIAGNLVALASVVLAVFLDAGSPVWQVALVLAMNGVAMALFVTPNTVMIMTSVDPAHLSQASGLVGTGRTGGMLMSMVIATTALRLAMGDMAAGPETVPQLVSAMKASFVVFGGKCAVSFLSSLLRTPKRG